MPDQPETEDKKTSARKKPAGRDVLAAQLAALGGPAPAPAKPSGTPGEAPRRTGARTRPPRTPAASTRKGTRTMTTPMAAEQARPAVLYSARVSHATTPGQLAELEQIRLAENTSRRAARRPAISIVALLRAATQICLDNDRLRAQMIKRAADEWS